MILRGKKLLVLTGCNGASDIIDYAKACGVYTIATDYHQFSDVKETADVALNISTTDIEGLLRAAEDYDVDGVITGTSESSMFAVSELCKRLNLPFYATPSALELVNNKSLFKHHLDKYGIKTPEDYTSRNYRDVEFPVVVKPVDSSGGKGISVCHDLSELDQAITEAKKFSRTDKFLIEKYLKDYPEVFANYTIVNGEISLSCVFDNKDKLDLAGSTSNLGIIRYFPSSRIDDYLARMNERVVMAIKGLQLKDGVITLQMFYDGLSFIAYEAGLRLGGTQSYIFTQSINGISALELLVNYSLTGRMSDDPDILEKDNPFFHEHCCQINFPLLPGVVEKIEGLDKLRSMDNILNVTQVRHVGDFVKNDNTTAQFAFRVHVKLGSSTFIDVAREIFEIVKYYDSNGSNMLYRFDLSGMQSEI